MMILCFISGLCFGSFVFAMYERFVAQKKLFTPRSFCFECGKKLQIHHLVPFFSFVFLRGKCAFCKSKINPLSLLCEIVSGFLFIFAFQSSENIFECVFLSLYLMSLLWLSLTDIKLKAVPELVLWLNFAFAFCFAFDENRLFSFFSGQFFNGGFLFYALIFAGGIFLLKSLVSCALNFKKQNEKLESMGEADILLIAGMGGILGLKLGFYMIFLACILALPCFLLVKKDFEMPFIPFLSLAFVGVFGTRGYW